ncbi:unnamed protein product, partial [Musa textilis]
ATSLTAFVSVPRTCPLRDGDVPRWLCGPCGTGGVTSVGQRGLQPVAMETEDV